MYNLYQSNRQKSFVLFIILQDQRPFKAHNAMHPRSTSRQVAGQEETLTAPFSTKYLTISRCPFADAM